VRSFVVSALLVIATPAFADPVDSGEEPAQKSDATTDAARSGNFLPFSTSPSSSASYATMLGGYDTARGGALVTTQLEARLHRRFYLALAGTFDGPEGKSLEPSVMGQLIVLDEKHQGLDLSIVGGWEHQGFNQVRDALGRIAVGKHVGGVYVLGSTAVGVGYNDNERYGELTLAGIGELAPHLYGGLDARGRMDLQHDTDPATEDAWAVQAGPVATYVAGPVAITAVAGVSALRQHQSPDDKVGALTMLGAGATF
jgi:hypothetical protein